MRKKKEVLLVTNCVQDFRLNRGWSRKDLSSLIGTTEKTIEALETDLYCPTVYLALCLSTAFDCNVEDLFKLEKYSEWRKSHVLHN